MGDTENSTKPIDEDKNEKKGTDSSETTNENSPLAFHVENLQKFACSMKDQIVERVEEMKNKTNNKNKNQTAADKNDDVDNKESRDEKVENIEDNRDNQSRSSFRSAGNPKAENEETKTAAVWLAPVAPAEAAKVKYLRNRKYERPKA